MIREARGTSSFVLIISSDHTSPPGLKGGFSEGQPLNLAAVLK